jgi:DNA polymerase-3 subunit epsilon
MRVFIPMRQIVLDTETTGLQTTDNHRIIEIGCIELVNRKFTGNRYHQYINPQRQIEEAAFAVHGLSNQFLEDKPLFSDIAQDFMDFINGAELIIHNAPFDVGFINYELSLTKKKWNKLADYCHVIDTLVLAKQLHVGQRNNLDALCKRYKIDNSKRDLHGALLDAHLLAQVYLAMTGGQGSLFDELKTTEAKGQSIQSAAASIKKVRKLIILKATPTEIAAHENKLKEMQ